MTLALHVSPCIKLPPSQSFNWGSENEIQWNCEGVPKKSKNEIEAKKKQTNIENDVLCQRTQED